jgi:hypothetical protein
MPAIDQTLVQRRFKRRHDIARWLCHQHPVKGGACDGIEHRSVRTLLQIGNGRLHEKVQMAKRFIVARATVRSRID